MKTVKRWLIPIIIALITTVILILILKQKHGKEQLWQSSLNQVLIKPISQKFINATKGETWVINDEFTCVLDEPEYLTTELEKKLYFLHDYLTWHTILHLTDIIGQFKIVKIIKSDGWMRRWKYVRYGKIKGKRIKICYGWILATRVQDAQKTKLSTHRDNNEKTQTLPKIQKQVHQAHSLWLPWVGNYCIALNAPHRRDGLEGEGKSQ